MSERHEHRRHCECDGCCSDLFSCGDPINVYFINNPRTPVPGIFVSTSCDRLIWRRTSDSTPGNIECTSCEIISIQRVEV